MKILGRDPTLWLAVATSVVMLIGTTPNGFLTGAQAVAFVVAINAVFAAVNAFAVRPISPVAFTYAVGSIISVLGAYNLNIPEATVGAINALVIPILALVTRNQVSPIPTALTKGSNAANPTTEALPHLGDPS
jgi:hypothetical protein